MLPRVEESEAPRITLARAVTVAQAHKPAERPLYVFEDDEEYPGMVFVGMAENSRALQDSKTVAIDAYKGEVLTQVDFENSFSSVVYKLHAQLLMGPGGSFVVGALGLCLLISLVTGAIVYGPMMRRFAFATLRRERHLRTLLADMHKLIGTTPCSCGAAKAWTRAW